MLSSLMILSYDVDIGAERPAADDPLAAFALTGVRLVPRFGRVFAPSVAVNMLVAAYGARTDAATGNELYYRFLHDITENKWEAEGYKKFKEWVNK